MNDVVEAWHLLPVLTHEFGHCIRSRHADHFDIAPFAMTTEKAEFWLRDFASDPSMKTCVEQPDESHDARWVRTILHLRHRLAFRADAVCSVSEVVGYRDLAIDVRAVHSALLLADE